MSDRVSSITNALRSNGFRLTAARKSIVAALVNTEGHVSADELVEVVHERSPGVGRMTVYRTLEVLTGLGLIRPVYQGSAAARYVLLADGHHHHMICSQCQRIIEFDQCSLADTLSSLSTWSQFSVEGHLLEIYGRCLDCQ